MNVVRAEAMGMCFGVKDAIAAADEVVEPSTVTIHGELVHNGEVLARLSEPADSPFPTKRRRRKCRPRPSS